MNWQEKIMEFVAKQPGATDRDLREHFGVSNQAINAPCRALVAKGLLIRKENPDKGGLIGNYPAEIAHMSVQEVSKESSRFEALQEEDIKRILHDKLVADGWHVKVAWGRNRGVDIDAVRGKERWMIEVKGPGSRNEMQNNYFVGILGEILQRMDDQYARYSIAFPQIDKFRRLWDELPELAKKRTQIDLLLVDKDGRIEILD